MRLLTVIAVLGLAGCNRALDSFEPFACATDHSCPAGYGCTADLKCVPLSNHPVIPCPTASSCPVGLVCDSVLGVCASDCSGGCSSETSCAQGGVCRPGKLEGQSCADNSECVDRTCASFASGALCVTPCKTGLDCESGFRACVAACAAPACASAINLCRLSCAACPAGWSCAGDTGCQPGKAVGFSCSADSDCASRRCLGPAGFAVCVDTCSTAKPGCSSPDATCVPGTGYCLRKCGAGQTCPNGGACLHGSCAPGKPVGAACSLSSECAGGSCRTNGYPGGSCVVEGCSSTDPCPAGAACTGVCETPDCLAIKSICLPSCTFPIDCRPGYACLNALGVKACRPNGAGAEGQSCTSGTDCANGFCISSPAGESCRTPCTGDASCGAGKLCSMTLLYSNANVCGSSCSPGVCGSSETCSCFENGTKTDGGSAKRGCQPKCTQNSNCFDGSTCDLSTGLCGRQPCLNAAACSAGSFCSWNQTNDANCTFAGSLYSASCRPRFPGAAQVGQRCEDSYCRDSICAGAVFASEGLCSVACPDLTGCPGGTTCASVDRPFDAVNGTGALQSIKLCVLPAAANINGPCSTSAQCPSQQECTRGFCNGRGTLGSPCPSHNGTLECSLTTTSWCTWRTDKALSTCSRDCTTDAECQAGGFPGGCCNTLTDSTDKVCWTAAMCGS